MIYLGTFAEHRLTCMPSPGPLSGSVLWSASSRGTYCQGLSLLDVLSLRLRGAWFNGGCANLAEALLSCFWPLPVCGHGPSWAQASAPLTSWKPACCVCLHPSPRLTAPLPSFWPKLCLGPLSSRLSEYRKHSQDQLFHRVREQGEKIMAFV